MTDNNGWIKIHRKMLQNPVVMQDADHLAVWIYLLLNATHKDIPAMFKGKKITLHPGQLITGRKKIAKVLSVDESKVKRILLCFESDQQIDRERSNASSLISILNWEQYQEDDRQNDQQKVQNIGLLPQNCSDFDTKATNKWPTETVDAKGFEGCQSQENDQQMTSQWPASDQPVTTNKNIRSKEDKNNNIYISTTDSENSDCGSVKPKPVEKTDAKKYTYEKALREAIRNKDREAYDRITRIAKVMGVEIDAASIIAEEKEHTK